MSNFVLNEANLGKINDLLEKSLMDIGVHQAMIIDMGGNVILSLNKGGSMQEKDQYSLAALAAANFGAMSSMGELVGEEDFSLLFHKGQKENFCFSKIGNDFLLIIIFSNEISLGLLRLKIKDIIDSLIAVLEK
jgi:predicted regulator of Ras-like GTPase activity (Roadblock/LC7/MglB family)